MSFWSTLKKVLLFLPAAFSGLQQSQGTAPSPTDGGDTLEPLREKVDSEKEDKG